MSESVYMSKPWLKSYEKGVPEFVKYQDVTLPEFLDRSARDFADRPALLFQGTSVSFRQLGDGGSFFRLPR
jgi:long-chain acyl-CoA synthetase